MTTWHDEFLTRFQAGIPHLKVKHHKWVESKGQQLFWAVIEDSAGKVHPYQMVVKPDWSLFDHIDQSIRNMRFYN